MSAKPTMSELLLLFRDASSVHSQKVLRALLADGTAWKRIGKPARLRLLSSLVFGPAGSPQPVPGSDRPRAPSQPPPMRLGGRFDLHADFEDPALGGRQGPSNRTAAVGPGEPVMRQPRRDKLR